MLDSSAYARWSKQSFELAIQDPAIGEALVHARTLEPVLENLSLPALRAAVRRHATPRDIQVGAEVLGAVVRSYQRGPRAIWAPVLLELIAPALIRAAVGLHAAPGTTLTRDDVFQQLAAEALDVASRSQFPAGWPWVKRQIMLRARERVVRWLAADRSRSSHRLALEPELPSTPAPAGIAVALRDLAGQGARVADLVLVYRARVEKERLADLAREVGLTEDALRFRVRRAVARLRRALVLADDQLRTVIARSSHGGWQAEGGGAGDSEYRAGPAAVPEADSIARSSHAA